MSENNTPRAIRFLPQVAVATTAVAVMPVVVVWWLHDRGVVTSPWLGVGVAVALSLAASLTGSAYWKRCSGSGDIFFSELLLWGWLHRFRAERRLAKTAGLLGLGESDTVPGLTPGEERVERTARLLREMAAVLDAQDLYTDGHSRRVALHSAMVARKMGLERDEVAKIRTGAAVHDIGKLRIPVELLNKPDALSAEEFEIVKRHANEGAAIVECMDDPEITEMVRHHHERFDGKGYPSGLIGEATPLGARIIAVADTFDALTSVRAYRSAIPHKQALEAIVDVSGTQLDPAVVRAFLRCYSANRVVLFWTLLLISPQRALAWIGGKTTGRGNLAAAATLATPVAFATVVVTTFSAAGGLVPARLTPGLAERGASPEGAQPTAPKPHALSSAEAQSAAPVARKHAVLGIRRTRGVLIAHSLAGGAGRAGGNRGAGSKVGKPPDSSKYTGGGGTATTSPASFTPPPSGSGVPVAVTVPPPSVSAPSSATSSSAAPAGGAGGGGTTSSPSGGSASGGPGGGTGSTGADGGPGGSQGGSGGNPGGQGDSGAGSSSGSGSGSGSVQGSGGNGSGSGSGQPLAKNDCKHGGYTRGGAYKNQGQCVSYVEQNLHR